MYTAIKWSLVCQAKKELKKCINFYYWRARSERQLKSLLMRWKMRVKSWLETQHSKPKIMISSPITSRQIEREKVETLTDFIFLGSKITSDGDCRDEIKRHLLLGRKFMTNLDSILKSRNITLPTKVHLVKLWFFPVVMYGYERWTLKKVECWRIHAFELWC